MKKDSLGDRMKGYEDKYRHKLDTNQPLIVRLDGRAFHTLTRGMEKPFDTKFMNAMKATMSYLMNSFDFKYGYCQSDEISLLWYKAREESQMIFGGNINKINSILASACSVMFNNILNYKIALFDCRCFNLPDEIETTNYFLWRAKDCMRNSITAVAQKYFSEKQLNGKSSQERLEMLKENNTSWESYSMEEKYGYSLKQYTSNERKVLIPTQPFISQKSFEERMEIIRA